MRNHTCLHSQQNIKLQAYLVTHYYTRVWIFVQLRMPLSFWISVKIRLTVAKSLQSDSQDSKITPVYSQWSKKASWTIAWRHFRSTFGLFPVITAVKIFSLKNFIIPKDSPYNVKEIFGLWPNLVVDILNFEPFCHAHDRYGSNSIGLTSTFHQPAEKQLVPIRCLIFWLLSESRRHENARHWVIFQQFLMEMQWSQMSNDFWIFDEHRYEAWTAEVK